MGQLNTIVPDKEPERQYYFIELLKDEIKKKAEKKAEALPITSRLSDAR